MEVFQLIIVFIVNTRNNDVFLLARSCADSSFAAARGEAGYAKSVMKRIPLQERDD
jgi:hypothetical protein